MPTEKYSVLMSLYKKENPEYFKLALDSMIFQSVAPDEIVIVEDGPLTKELYDVLNDYKLLYPDLIKIVISEENIGLGQALNLGLRHCQNELVARMDTDDISLPDRCVKQLEEFEIDKDLDLLGTAIDEFCDSPDTVISRRVVPTEHNDIYNFAKRRSAFNHPTVMYKKSKVLALGGYGDLRRNQDIDLFGRMLFNGCKAKNLKESYLLFRSNENLSKRRKSWVNTKSYITTIKKFWKMGYSSFVDYCAVVIAQTIVFMMPVKVQNYIYRKFLRK